jgi:hypothetical protein
LSPKKLIISRKSERSKEDRKSKGRDIENVNSPKSQVYKVRKCRKRIQ